MERQEKGKGRIETERQQRAFDKLMSVCGAQDHKKRIKEHNESAREKMIQDFRLAVKALSEAFHPVVPDIADSWGLCSCNGCSWDTYQSSCPEGCTFNPQML